MNTDRADGAHGTPFVSRWQDSITVVEYDGRPVVVGREFGALLAYGNAGQGLTDLIGSDWSDEFIVDVDYIVLRNGRLAAFKQLCMQFHLPLVDKRAPSLLLLTESGIQLVLARTEKPEGKVFRRWLVSECIPAYQATRALPGPTPPPALPGAPRSAPETARLPGVQVLRRVLERMRPAMEPGAYAALDALVEEVEESSAEASPGLTSIDAIPVPRDRREGSATEDVRITLCSVASSALVGLRTDDLHRLIVWSATRPLRGQARRALTTRGGGR